MKPFLMIKTGHEEFLVYYDFLQFYYSPKNSSSCKIVYHALISHPFEDEYL